MKKLVFALSLFSFFTLASQSQTYVKPETGLISSKHISIEKVTRTDTSIILTFKGTFKPGTKILIPKHTAIIPHGSKEELFIVSAGDVRLNKNIRVDSTGIIICDMVFPPLADTVTRFDYAETKGNWFILDINLNPKSSKGIIPHEIKGVWYSNKLCYAPLILEKNVAIYNNKVWEYGSIKFKKKKGSIQLISEEKTLTLNYQVNNNELTISNSSGLMMELAKNKSKMAFGSNPELNAYTKPIFKMDTAIYSGCFVGYNDRIEFKTLTVHVDNILTGNQNSYSVKVNSDGSFSGKIPMYYPGIVYIRSNKYRGSIYLEPGKSIYQVLGMNNILSNSEFMGESAAINNELNSLDNIPDDHKSSRENLLDITLNEYKSLLMNLLNQDLKYLDSLKNIKLISEKAYQVKSSDVKYSVAIDLLHYSKHYVTAYRNKHKINGRISSSDLNIQELNYKHLDVINNKLANNPVAPTSVKYDRFMNTLDNYSFFKTGPVGNYTLKAINYMKNNGYTLNDQEEKLAKLLGNDSINKAILNQHEFRLKHMKESRPFYKHFNSDLKAFSLVKPGFSYQEFVDYLNEKDIVLTDQQTTYLNKIIKYEESKSGVIYYNFMKEYGEEIMAFRRAHTEQYKEFSKSNRIENRNQQLRDSLNIKDGLLFDIMTAQNILKEIVKNMSPLELEKLKTIQASINDPFIKNYIELMNNKTLAKIEENKTKGGYTINETPTAEDDHLFDSIMAKYQGKVVYVDFWATWCAPCRSSIAKIKPLKEEMKEDNIAFVYITSPSSPEKAWANTIPDIKGEHYRVTDDQWKCLCEEFKITGIPHYALVNKEGKVIDSDMARSSNSGLHKTFLKYMD